MSRRITLFPVLVVVVAVFTAFACSDAEPADESVDEAREAVHPASVLEVPRAKDPKPEEALRLTPDDAEFDTFPSEFDEFPLYWVGHEFQGHELRYIARHVFSPEKGKHEDKVSLLYGTCEFPEGEGGCPPPVQVIISPYCMVPPELLGGGEAPSNIGTVRGGAEAVESGGGLRIWTGTVTVKIYGASQDLVDGVVASLVSPNGLGPTQPEADLPPPDRDCSDYEMVPLG